MGLVSVIAHLAFKLTGFKKECFMWLGFVGHVATALLVHWLEYRGSLVAYSAVLNEKMYSWLSQESDLGFRTPGNASKFTLYRPHGSMKMTCAHTATQTILL